MLHFELKFLELPELLLKWKYLSHHVLMSRMMKQGGTIKAESGNVFVKSIEQILKYLDHFLVSVLIF